MIQLYTIGGTIESLEYDLIADSPDSTPVGIEQFLEVIKPDEDIAVEPA